jgi:cytochrome P450
MTKGDMLEIPSLLRDRKLPLVGHALSYAPNPPAFLERMAGDYQVAVPLSVVGRDVWLLSNPEHVERLLRTDAAKFRKPYGDFPVMRALVGNGMVASDGEFWLRQRRLAQPAFHKGRIARYAETMHRLAAQTLATWRDGQTLDAHGAMMNLTLEVVAECLFGTDLTRESGVHRKVDTLMRLVHRQVAKAHPLLQALPTPSNRAYTRALADLDAILNNLIRAQRARDEDDSLLSMLVSARDDADVGMSDAQLLDELKTLFLAGYESSANALTWTMYLLTQHEPVMLELQREIDTTLHGQPATLDMLPRLPFLDAVIRESLRLYPPAWNLARTALEDVRFGDAVVRRGQLVMASQWVIHRNPRHYPDPQTFRPQRWLEGLARTLPDFAFMPFSGGVRKCIGDDFARLEIAVVLVALCQRLSFSLEPGFRVQPRAGLTLHPKNGLRVQIRSRRGVPEDASGQPIRLGSDMHPRNP